MSLRKTTGLTGLPVCKDPKHTLKVLYGKIARALALMPAYSAYRRYAEEIVAFRLSIVENAKCPKEIEEQINCGMVEELVVQAENELNLARNFLYSKPWQSLISKPQDQWLWPPKKAQ